MPLPGRAETRSQLLDRIGIMCNLDVEETASRKVLALAREAGFRRIQVKFPWTRVSDAYIRNLPGWIRSEDLHADALGAYVNCVDPKAVLMDTLPEHLPRAIELAGQLNCKYLVAWTGGYSANMSVADPRNNSSAAEGAIVKFLGGFTGSLDRAGINLALESYITLACPDAVSLRRTLDRLPDCISAVMDPPNLTPVNRFADRDQVLREMFATLLGRIGVVHMKDFRLNPAGDGYILPGPLEGEMNYPLFFELIRALPSTTPLIAEHVPASRFPETRSKLQAIINRLSDAR